MTRARPSLSAKLLVRLIVAQTVIYVAAMLVWMFYSPYTTYEDLAAASARRVVADAVAPDRDGALRIVPTPRLRAYQAARPGFAFAAIAGGKVVPGSSPRLAATLARLGPFAPHNGRLDMESAGLGNKVRFTSEPGQDLVIVTAANRFRLDDAPVFVPAYLPVILPIAGPALLGAMFVVPFVVRRALRPLRAAGAAAAAIDVRSLDRRLPAAGIPAEVAPFVGTINALLDRLDEGLRRQSRFTANAAHELRTPVAILRARVDGMPESPAKQALISDCTRLAVLVNQLLDAARLEQHEVALDEEVDLVPLLRDLVADWAPMAIRSGRAIALETMLPRATVRGNGAALRSAIANLVDNGLRVEPEGGVVLVRLAAATGGSPLTVHVIDHGPGIAAEDAGAVFEPFWRKDDFKPGTGLGLAIVREIVCLHGGQVGHARTPGGGASFAIVLPSLASTVRAEARAAEAAPA
jgi:signal transduction histidine kinase